MRAEIASHTSPDALLQSKEEQINDLEEKLNEQSEKSQVQKVFVKVTVNYCFVLGLSTESYEKSLRIYDAPAHIKGVLVNFKRYEPRIHNQLPDPFFTTHKSQH